jgi:hypothetical protein
MNDQTYGAQFILTLTGRIVPRRYPRSALARIGGDVTEIWGGEG